MVCLPQSQSNQSVAWLCNAFGHKWSQTPNVPVKEEKKSCLPCLKHARTKQVNCPTIAENPALLAQWEYKRNADQGHFFDSIRLQINKQIS